MTAGKTSDRGRGDLKPALSRFAARVSSAVPSGKGGIHICCTDCDDEYTVAGLGEAGRVADVADEAGSVVRINAPSSVVQDVIEGRLDAVEAMVRGGVRVRGDVAYLERVLRDAGLIHCEE